MAAKPSNAMNLTSTVSGLVNWDGVSSMSTTALTQYYTLVGASTNTVAAIAPGAAGTVLTSGGASANPSYTALPFTKMPWTDEASLFTAVSNNGYFCTATFAVTMPVSPAQGDTISFIVDGSFGVTITANTGQTLQNGSAKSASAGTCLNAATTTGCSITFVYRLSDTNWIASSVIGTWTIT
jgi:hypothetical protein